MTDIAKRDRPDALPSRHSLQIDPRVNLGDEAMAVRRIAHRLLKKKRLIALVFLVVLVPAAIATYLATPLYRSVALVQVNPDPVQVMPYRDVADTPIGGANFDNYMGTQEQILKSVGLRERVANRLKSEFKHASAGLEAGVLGDRFAVRKIEKSQLFELTYRAAETDAAAVVVNLYAEEFVRQNFEMRQATRLKAEQSLKEELGTLEKRLQLSEKELMTYAQVNDIMSLEQGQVDPLQQRLTILTQQLADSEGQVAIARSSYDSIQQASVTEFPQRLVTQEIAQLQNKQHQLEQELTTLRTTFGKNWPSVVEKQNETGLVRDQLAREKAATLAREKEQARLDLQGADARRRTALQALSDHKGLVNQFHDASIKYSVLKREVDTNRNLYEGLLERLRQTGVLAGFQFGNIQVVEIGRPNRIVDSPKVLWNLGIAAALGLALGVCLVVLGGVWDTSISTLEDAEQLALLPTLGSVPLIRLLKANGHRSLNGTAHFKELSGASSSDSDAGAAVPFEVTEGIRGVCASILLSKSDRRPRVIAVTSATPGEGKTTVVSHLARAFAEAGLKTLVVEADLRKPDLSKNFSIGKEDGLSLYLAGLVSPLPKIHKTDTPNLFVTAGGPVPPNPAALLHSERLTAFLTKAAAEYEIVILDAPPVLSMADARILGTKADGVVLVVRAGRTGSNLVLRAGALLENSGAHVLGMVLNGWEPGRSEMSYYRYYQPDVQSDAKSA